MPYIPLKENLPGITGLLDYRKDTALPIRELTEILLRGESTLSEGERELIASVVSHGNECSFCSAAHSATADLLLKNEGISDKVKSDVTTAPVSVKMKTLLTIAAATQKNGKLVTQQMVDAAKAAGATDREVGS